MKKLVRILVVVLLGLSVVGCTAEDIAIWKESNRRWKENGVMCKRYSGGEFICKDRNGRVYGQ